MQHADTQGKLLENVVLQCSSGREAETGSLMTELYDLSLLRFQQRDDIAEVFRTYSSKVMILTLLRSANPCCR